MAPDSRGVRGCRDNRKGRYLVNKKRARKHKAGKVSQGKQILLPFEKCGKDVMRHAPEGMTAAYRNNIYSVMVFPLQTKWGEVTNLMIRRHDSQPIRKWRDLQHIKNVIAGKNREAVEMFPPEGEVVDDQNIYHIWVLPEGKVLPFGLNRGGGAVGIEEKTEERETV